MFSDFFAQAAPLPAIPKEGELYKEVTVGGKIFRLLYGYYEAFEREAQNSEPMPIYPDFLKNPHFTHQGIPLVTAMQNICLHYSGKPQGDSCSQCIYFEKSEELFGFCNCPKNRRDPEKGMVAANEL